ncbi:MAG: carbohydrate ABC transporter permease [Bacilli bacterium]|nr:carbohydrate ABC transporter permease [Bacilli bacterium]
MKTALKRSNHLPKERLSIFAIVLLVVLAIYSVSLVGLLLFSLFTSFQDPGIFTFAKAFSWPEEFHFNIGDLFSADKLSILGRWNGKIHKYSFVELFGISLWYSLTSGVVKTLVPCLVAYACARYRFKSSAIIYTLVIIVMAIPVVGNQPSEFKVVNFFGLYNNLFFIWVLKFSFLGMYFLVFYEHFRSMPDSFSEAAKIDGASNTQILLRIGLPLARNVFLTVFIIEFIVFWNDYQTPLIYLKDYPTLAYEMYNAVIFGSQPGLDKIPQKAGATIVILLPALALFLAFHKKLLGNLTIGGIKG